MTPTPEQLNQLYAEAERTDPVLATADGSAEQGPRRGEPLSEDGLESDSLAAKDLHAAVTLARAARSRVTRLVADARDEEASWAEIRRILGTGRLWALIRYGPLWRRRRTPLVLD